MQATKLKRPGDSKAPELINTRGVWLVSYVELSIEGFPRLVLDSVHSNKMTASERSKQIYQKKAPIRVSILKYNTLDLQRK